MLVFILLIVMYAGELNLTDEEEMTVHVDFPRNTLNTAIYACVELLYYDAFYVSKELFESNFKALAGPVLSLGPNGCQFKHGVQITIPLPKGDIVSS